MNEQENVRARAEAQKSTMSSADRARFWAGLNRYLAAEAVHEHQASEREGARDTNPDAQTDISSNDKSDDQSDDQSDVPRASA